MPHFFNKLNEEHFTFHLQYKYPGTFANRKYEQLSYPKNPKMCDSILVSPLKMQPYYSQSGRENVTPSSGTSVLASYKKVSHPNLKKKFQCYYEKLLLPRTMQLVTFIVKDYVTCEFFEHQRVSTARLNNMHFLKAF